MKARITFAASAVAFLFASQASASVISASSQTVRSKPADRVGYLNATGIQNDLNSTLRQATDASVPTALGSPNAPSTTSGGFLLGGDRQQSNYGAADNNLFNPDSEKKINAISRDGGPPVEIENGSTADGRRNEGGGFGGHGGKQGRHRDRDKGDVHATPEPSTWLLLGAGLTMAGVYEVLRRRGAA